MAISHSTLVVYVCVDCLSQLFVISSLYAHELNCTTYTYKKVRTGHLNQPSTVT